MFTCVFMLIEGHQVFSQSVIGEYLLNTYPKVMHHYFHIRTGKRISRHRMREILPINQYFVSIQRAFFYLYSKEAPFQINSPHKNSFPSISTWVAEYAVSNTFFTIIISKYILQITWKFNIRIRSICWCYACNLWDEKIKTLISLRTALIGRSCFEMRSTKTM